MAASGWKLLRATFGTSAWLALLWSGSTAAASEGAAIDKLRPIEKTICQIVTSAAQAEGLPIGFLTRLIWQESSFRLDAISAKGAEGIAQFMPGTAAERGLANPFDPAEAIPKAAELLADLKRRFGNLGLAAAAYNAGPARVAHWRAGDGSLPEETRAFVARITQRTVEDWLNAAPPAPAPDADASKASLATCLRYAAAFRRQESYAIVGAAVSAPWGVQLAGSFSKAAALAAFRRAQRRYSTILGDIQPMILATPVMSLGFHPYYRIRAPAPTRAAANALCRRLERVGGACAVLRN